MALEDFDSLEEKRLSECTFSPSINFTTKSAGSIDRFDVWDHHRQSNLRRRQIEMEGAELEGCTFKPEVKSKRPVIEDTSVFEHLYEVIAYTDPSHAAET